MENTEENNVLGSAGAEPTSADLKQEHPVVPSNPDEVPAEDTAPEVAPEAAAPETAPENSPA